MIKPSRTTITALAVSASALVSIALHESYQGDAYTPVPGDVPTIGFGTTQGVKIGDKITPPRALVMLLKDADDAAQAVKRCAPVPMYQTEFDAYTSLTYNIGPGAFCNSSIPGKLRRGEYEAACKTILDFECGPTSANDPKKAKDGERCYRKDGKSRKVLRGLTNRRQAEYQLCITNPDAAPSLDAGAVARGG